MRGKSENAVKREAGSIVGTNFQETKLSLTRFRLK
jgi:hypothetical protein